MDYSYIITNYYEKNLRVADKAEKIILCVMQCQTQTASGDQR